MNRPADPLERGASVVELDRAATAANGMSPEAEVPTAPAVSMKLR